MTNKVEAAVLIIAALLVLVIAAADLRASALVTGLFLAVAAVLKLIEDRLFASK